MTRGSGLEMFSKGLRAFSRVHVWLFAGFKHQVLGSRQVGGDYYDQKKRATTGHCTPYKDGVGRRLGIWGKLA